MKKKLKKIINTNRTKIKSKIFQIAAVVLIIDQFVKILVTLNLKEMKSYEIINNFFSLYYVKNTGAAFSILEDQTLILIILSLVVLIVLNNYITLLTKTTKLERVSLGLIIGGILGNLIDRLLYNSVIDFLSFKIFNYSFPVFNLADTAIVIGVILFIIASIKENISNKDAKELVIDKKPKNKRKSKKKNSSKK